MLQLQVNMNLDICTNMPYMHKVYWWLPAGLVETGIEGVNLGCLRVRSYCIVRLGRGVRTHGGCVSRAMQYESTLKSPLTAFSTAAA